MPSIEQLATVYGVLMSLAPLLQARKMWRRRSSGDVSIPYLAVLLVGFGLYLAYGVSISNRLLIITNTVSIGATATTLALAVSLLGRSPATH
ncbi:MAG: SemiSWEET family transporter [Actinomycetota bacterium]